MNKKEREFQAKVRELGCIICRSPAALHHALTGAGGRKDERYVLPLCHFHHQGEQSIHTLSRRVWQEIYGTERELLEQVYREIGEEIPI